MITGAPLLEALDELCERRAYLQLATPYLSFPAHAMERRGEELRLRVTLTQDFVTRTLGPQALRIRFPWGLGMAGGPVKVIGYQMEDGKRILRLRVPQELTDDDRRLAVRLVPPGHCSATLSADGETLVRAKVEDISLLGVRVFAVEPLNAAYIDNHAVQLSLSLESGPSLNSQAKLVHQDGQTLGLAFLPALEPLIRQELEAYLAPELEEAKKRWEDRAALRALAEARSRPKRPPEGLLLVGRDRGLEENVLKILPESLPLRTCPPALAPLREALDPPPKLVVLHYPKADLQERFLLKSLAEALPAATPVVVLGAPGIVGGREFTANLRAATYAEWNPAQAVFFSRLLQGLVRKRWGAPEE
jgi:hypothetical protein